MSIHGEPATTRLDRGRRLTGEVVRFGLIGAVAYGIDVGLYNLLVFGIPAVLVGPLAAGPLWAKALSMGTAGLFTWVGNRLWTFRSRRRRRVHHELLAFAVVNVLSMGIAVGTLGFSRYVLGLSGPVADNISANVIGFGLATAFRFWGYRTFVFNGTKGPG